MSELVAILAWNTGLAILVGGIGWMVWRVTKRSSLAHALYLLAVIKLVTPPVFVVGAPILPPEPASPLATVDEPVPARASSFEVRPPAEPVSAPRPVIPARKRPHAAPPPALLEILGALWALGALVVIAVTLRRMYLLRRLLARADDAPPRVQEIAREVAATLDIARLPRICIVDATLSPSLCAIGRRPVVVLPRDLLRQLEDNELSAVLTHELSHLANRDHLTRWLELVVGAVHWWNPVALWLRRGIREVEEVRCDARAVAALAWHPRRYGRVILKTACALQARPVPFAAAGLGEVESLKRRMQMMINGKLRHGLNWPIRLALLAGAGTLLPLGVQAQERHEDVRVEIKKNAGEIGDLVKKLVSELKAQDKSEKPHEHDVKEKVEKALQKVKRLESKDAEGELGKRIEEAIRRAIKKSVSAYRGAQAGGEHAEKWQKLFEGSGHDASDLAKAIRKAVGKGAEIQVIGPHTKTFSIRDIDNLPEALRKAIKSSIAHVDIEGGGDVAKAVRDAIKKSVHDQVDVKVYGPIMKSFSVDGRADIAKKLRKAFGDRQFDIIGGSKLSERIEKALRKAYGETPGHVHVVHSKELGEKSHEAKPERRNTDSAKTKELLDKLEDLKAQIRDLERRLRR